MPYHHAGKIIDEKSEKTSLVGRRQSAEIGGSEPRERLLKSLSIYKLCRPGQNFDRLSNIVEKPCRLCLYI